MLGEEVKIMMKNSINANGCSSNYWKTLYGQEKLVINKRKCVYMCL